jgi:hypothetical protein
MRVTRIELAYPAWEADVLPLNYTRVSAYKVDIYTDPRAFVKGKIALQRPTCVKVNCDLSRSGVVSKWGAIWMGAI